MTLPPAPTPPGYWTPRTAPTFGGAPGRAPTNIWAWTGFIVSVSGFLFNFGVNGLVGAAFSIAGLREARRLAAAGHTETGRQLALVGLITGIVHLVISIAVAVASVILWGWFVQWMQQLPATLDQWEQMSLTR